MLRKLFCFLLCVSLSLPAVAADLSITAASVVPSSGAATIDVTSGATITAGKLCYINSTDGKAYLADANGTAATKVLRGIALNAASAGQPVRLQTAGTITIGATVTVGEIYVLSATAGGICPEADLATGHTVSIVGVATTTTAIFLNIFNSGAEVP